MPGRKVLYDALVFINLPLDHTTKKRTRLAATRTPLLQSRSHSAGAMALPTTQADPVLEALIDGRNPATNYERNLRVLQFFDWARAQATEHPEALTLLHAQIAVLLGSM